MTTTAHGVVRVACPHDCPDTCAMEVTVEGGRAVKIRGADGLPFTNGALCTKVAHYLERVYCPQRLLHPMKRVGKKGEGRFERISITWDEALDTIAERFRAIAADDPRAILPYSYRRGAAQRRSFANLPRFVAQEGGPTLEIHPEDAAARAIEDGARLRIFNDRGAFHARAVVTARVHRGVVAAPSLWWRKQSGDGQNANSVTSAALTDMGGGAVFYDCLVDVVRT
jgi:anaerobic selenocysteine-containing dehydrogenase